MARASMAPAHANSARASHALGPTARAVWFGLPTVAAFVLIFLEAAPAARWVGGLPFGAVFVVGLMGIPFASFAWLVLKLPTATAVALGVFVGLSWPIALAVKPAILGQQQATVASAETTGPLRCTFQARVTGEAVAAAVCDPGHGIAQSKLVAFEDQAGADSAFQTLSASVAADATAVCSDSARWRPSGGASDSGSVVRCTTSDSAWIIWNDPRTHSVASARRTDRNLDELDRWFSTLP
ncbi:MAG: hypothetical protein QOJ57_1981 [Thermoleophilaceae bacterium]|nr:hypothetical protein [Thermoleophilaceae bacterium]